jgi:hypothetical protein
VQARLREEDAGVRKALLRVLEWAMVGYAALVWVILAVIALPLVLVDGCLRRLP